MNKSVEMRFNGRRLASMLV